MNRKKDKKKFAGKAGKVMKVKKSTKARKARVGSANPTARPKARGK